MSRRLPTHPNLEFLKNQAKDLLADRRAAHPAWKLTDAQHALACEYGFDSWPKLKAHVESRDRAASPFAGRWIANVAQSTRHPVNLFQRATLEFAVAGDTVTITHDAIDEAGRSERGVNVVEADGVERVRDYGIRATVQWGGARTLQVMMTHAGLPATNATYEVSPDGRTLTVSTIDQRLVFDRA